MNECCWNEELKEWYPMESISPDKEMCSNCKSKFIINEDRCLINGCQEIIACSFCGGCEEHHKDNLQYNKCDIDKEMKKEVKE